MSYLTQLRLIIDAEPANVARTDEEVLAWLNEGVTRYNDIPWKVYALWAARHDAILRMEVAKANDALSVDVRRAAATGLLVLNAGESLSLSNSEVRAIMGNLVPEAFTPAERDDLLAFSRETVARWKSEALSGGRSAARPGPTIHDVAKARAL